MVYHFLDALDWTNYLDKHLAEALYTGITTDTGNFRFSSTSQSTHQVAGELLALGVESQKVASRVYDSNTPSRFKLLSRALNSMEVFPEYHAAIIYLTEEDMEECGYKKGDTEGFVNYGLSLIGIELSAFVCPRDGVLKLSFRSKTTFDVNTFSRKNFKGGGHRNAAGGSSSLSLEDTIIKIKALLPEYAEELKKLAGV
jgi:phosphoesterase RecJ-like protein